MLKSYLKIAWRNMLRHKAYAAINITGLSIGMAVAILIGCWLWDELSYNKYHDRYDRIAQVLLNEKLGGIVETGDGVPFPLGPYLRQHYGSYFSRVVEATRPQENIITYGEKQLEATGRYMSSQGPDLLSLRMQAGAGQGLDDPQAILLSASLAQSLFGNEAPVGKIIKLNNQDHLKVIGVYEDIVPNSSFSGTAFIAPWKLYIRQGWIASSLDSWGGYSLRLFVELAPHADISKVSAQISPIVYQHNKSIATPALFLHPMRKWNLYNEFKNGVNTGGRIRYCWLYAIIGVFVLLLACINFMNLSTARSEKRAKEVGVRKSAGAPRQQLVAQFLTESFLVVLLSFGIALLITWLAMPAFNQLADKQMTLPWGNVVFWLLCAGFILLTGLLAGSYPAFYLSSFRPVKVLKGTFQAGRLAAVPRKVLVVLQFSISLALIIGTIVVFRQVQHAQQRPTGYDRERLISIRMNTPELWGHYNGLRHDLIQSGAAENMARSSSPTTSIWSLQDDFDWKGKDPELIIELGAIACSHDFGRTVGWQVTAGRDFSRDFPTDTGKLVVNESAVRLMGLQQPVGERIRWGDQYYTIIGVVKDMVMTSPFGRAVPTVFTLNYDWAQIITVKLARNSSLSAALDKTATVFKKYNPGSPFSFKFNDEEYDYKFRQEQRTGQLVGVLAALAIFISCLGIFGLATFIAAQRTKEIGVRKVLGATVAQLWGLLSKDFIRLVLIAFLVATPAAWYFMEGWLQRYEYRTSMAWWIFAVAGGLTLLIALLTVSYQGIRAALANPARSLRSE